MGVFWIMAMSQRAYFVKQLNYLLFKTVNHVKSTVSKVGCCSFAVHQFSKFLFDYSNYEFICMIYLFFWTSVWLWIWIQEGFSSPLEINVKLGIACHIFRYACQIKITKRRRCCLDILEIISRANPDFDILLDLGTQVTHDVEGTCQPWWRKTVSNCSCLRFKLAGRFSRWKYVAL